MAIKQDAESVARTALIGLGSLARSIGQMNLARTRLEQAMTLARRHGDSSSEGIILLNQAEIDLWAGELDAAEARSTRALALGQELNEEPLIAPALASLGRLARRRGHRDEARALYRDSLRRFRALEYQTEIAAVLEEIAGVAADDGRPEAAARLWGAAAALRETLGAPLPPVERPDYERDVTAARAALGEPTFTAVWEAGRSEPLAQAVSSALE
jgi:tetratricopeptide (TPR) repeat protein